MTSGGIVPRELHDSVREALGKKVKIALMRKVKLEVKQDKIDERVLVMSACRMYVMTARTPKSQRVSLTKIRKSLSEMSMDIFTEDSESDKSCPKIEMTFHYLDIQAIESKKLNQLKLTVDGKMYNFQTMDIESEDMDHVVIHIGTALKAVFPLVPIEKIIRQIDVVPSNRIRVMYDMIKDIEAKDAGPCGGYSNMYACMCDYYNLRHQEEVAWDVDTIYLSHDSHELCLGDFDHLESKDLVPIIAALEHNPWFTSLKANGTKLNSEVAAKILMVMKKNTTIEELHLSGVGFSRDFAEKLNIALLSNSQSLLSTLDLSKNSLEDRGSTHLSAIIKHYSARLQRIETRITHLSGPVSHLSKGLVNLNLSKTGMMGKGVNKLCESLSQNKYIPNTLQLLDLSGNSLTKGEEPINMFNFLAQPNAISHLNLSSANLALDVIIAPLLRGCSQHLSHLDLSHNTFTFKKVVEIPQAWKQFFSSAFSLKDINLSGNKLNAEAVKSLLLGVSSNKEITDMKLNISGNDLKTAGAQVIGSCIAELRNISSLDISDNGFDSDLKNILPWVSKNKGLRHLAIGKNVSGLRSKHLTQVLDTVVDMIQDEDSQLQSLSLADSKLRSDSAIVIGALGSNSMLTHLDISGNMMGDFGARMLAKALMINTKLQEIYWDKNNTSAHGFEDMVAALEKNYAVRKMPTPLHDAADALRSHPERTRKAVERIETLLHRNHSPRKFATEQAYRLQQGFLISATQQLVDRLVVQVQDTVNALTAHPKNDGDADLVSDITNANKLITDADNSKQLLPKLQQVAIESESEGNAVEVKLQSIAEELRVVLIEQLKKNVSGMLQCAEERCPAVVKDQDSKSKIEEVCNEKSSLPGDFSQALIMDQIGTDVMNKVSEINLAVATYISDEINDGVLESLSKKHKTLTNHLNELRKRTETSKEKEQRKSFDSVDDKEPTEIVLRTPDEEEKEVTPVQNKRSSVHSRRKRPKSCVGETSKIKVIDIDLDEPSVLKEEDEPQEAPPDSLIKSPSIDEEKDGFGKDVVDSVNVAPIPKPAEHAPPKVVKASTSPKKERKKSDKGSDTSVSEFEAISPSQTLECLTKSRPKFKKTARPTRRPDTVASLDEEVDTFYNKMDVSREVKLVEPVKETPKPAEEPVQPKEEPKPKEEAKTNGETSAPETKSSSSKKAKGWSPFGSSGSGGIKEGISSFFNKNKKKESTKSESPTKAAKQQEKTPEIARKESAKTPDSAREESVKLAVVETKTDEADGPDVTAKPTEEERDKTQEDEKAEEVKEIAPRKPMGVGMPGMGVPISMDMLQAKRATMKPGALGRNQDAAGSDKKALVPPPKHKSFVAREKSQENASTPPLKPTASAQSPQPPPATHKSSPPVTKSDSSIKSSPKASPRPSPSEKRKSDSEAAKDKTTPVKPPSSVKAEPFKLPSPAEKRKSGDDGGHKEAEPLKPSLLVKHAIKLPSPAELFKTAENSSAPKPVAKVRSSAVRDSSPQSNGEVKRPPPPTRPKPPPTKPKPKPAAKPRSSIGAPDKPVSSVDSDKSGVVRPVKRQSVKDIRELLDSAADTPSRSSTLPKGSSDVKVDVPVRPASSYASRTSSLDEFRRIQNEVKAAEASAAAELVEKETETVRDSDPKVKESDQKLDVDSEPKEAEQTEAAESAADVKSDDVKSEVVKSDEKPASGVETDGGGDAKQEDASDAKNEDGDKIEDDKSLDDSGFVVVDHTDEADNKENEELVMV